MLSELSDSARNFKFETGEYKDMVISEMLNHYLVIQYMEYFIKAKWYENKAPLIELVNYAHKYRTHLQK